MSQWKLVTRVLYSTDNSKKYNQLNQIKRNLSILFIASYIYFIFLNIKRISYRVAFEEFLWDYKYGICRRALEGQLFTFIHNGKFTDQYFIHLSLTLNIIAFLIFILIAYKLISNNINYIYLILFYITSPLTFKNQIYDIGRQDLLGFILTEIIVLLCLYNLRKLSAVFFTISILPLCLIADNNVLFWGPTCISIIFLSPECHMIIDMKTISKIVNISVKTTFIVALLSFITALTIPFLLKQPTISESSYRDYLQTKAVYSIYYPGNTGYSTGALYLNINNSSIIQAHSFLAQISVYKAALHNIFDYVFFILPFILIFAVATKYINKKQILIFSAYLLLIILFYFPAFYITTDFPRYFSNLVMCIYMLIFCLIYKTKFVLTEYIKIISVIYICIQIYINSPFGVAVEEGNIITTFSFWLLDGIKGLHFNITR